MGRELAAGAPGPAMTGLAGALGGHVVRVRYAGDDSDEAVLISLPTGLPS